MKTIFVFAGTRSEIIRLAPVLHELERRAGRRRICFCFTGQHLELTLPLLDFLQISPDLSLQLTDTGQDIAQQLAVVAAQTAHCIGQHRRAVAALVQGDSPATLMAALMAFYQRIPVAHVEAGLRTRQVAEPFPGELNRRLVSRIATWHYAATTRARRTLLEERVAPEAVLVTGSTGITALRATIDRNLPPEQPLLNALKGRRLVLVSLNHRSVRTAGPDSVLQAVRQLALSFQEVHFLLPIRDRAGIAGAMESSLGGLENVYLIDALSYGDMVWTLQQGELILTDSGGIEEEACYLQKPVLVLRDETERPEAMDYGTSILVGRDTDRIVVRAQALLDGEGQPALSEGPCPYGSGEAAGRIVEHLLEWLAIRTPLRHGS